MSMSAPPTALCGIMNAARENVPIIFTSGRTPLTEEGAPGARSIYIHWGQEMFDQAGVVREMVKWDYELRNARQLETIVDRAVTLAMSEPRGPVYLTLPREVLAEKPDAFQLSVARPAPGGEPAGRRPRRDRPVRGLDRRGREPADHHRPAPARTRRAPRRSARSPSVSRCRWSATGRAMSACRAIIRCMSVSSPARCARTPT